MKISLSHDRYLKKKQILREMMFKVAKLEFKSCLISESNILIFKDIFRKREDQIATLFFFAPRVGGSTPCGSVRTAGYMRKAEASSREGWGAEKLHRAGPHISSCCPHQHPPT